MITIQAELIEIIEEMMWEFDGSNPEVVLIPSQIEECALDGGKIRAATIFNPEWYQRMCRDFPPVNCKNYQPFRKKQRTNVNRKHILHVFRCIIKNHKSRSKYTPYIIDEAQRRLETYIDIGEAPF